MTVLTNKNARVSQPLELPSECVPLSFFSVPSVFSVPSALDFSFFFQLLTLNFQPPVSSESPIFQFHFSNFRFLLSMHWILPRFPFLAQAPHRLAQTHRQRRNRFHWPLPPLPGSAALFSVAFL